MCMFVSFIVICRGENFKYKNTKINSQQKQQQQEGKNKERERVITDILSYILLLLSKYIYFCC